MSPDVVIGEVPQETAEESKELFEQLKEQGLETGDFDENAVEKVSKSKLNDGVDASNSSYHTNPTMHNISNNNNNNNSVTPISIDNESTLDEIESMNNKTETSLESSQSNLPSEVHNGESNLAENGMHTTEEHSLKNGENSTASTPTPQSLDRPKVTPVTHNNINPPPLPEE
jgi:hypothetical protein